MPTSSDMRVLVVAQQKGGVGKTTLSKMLAVYASREDLGNKRVLLIDLDYQASLSKLVLQMDYSPEKGTLPPVHPEYDEAKDPDWNGRSSSADIFFEGNCVPYPVTHPYPVDKLMILPAHKAKLQEVEEQDRTRLRERVHNRLFEFLSLEEVRASFDLVIIDTGPKESPLVRTALRAATHLIVPLTLETQCIDGLAEMLELWQMERRTRSSNRQLILAGLVINRYDARYSIHQAYLSQLSNDPAISPLLASTVLPQRASVAERDSRAAIPGTLFDLPKSQDIRDKAIELCADIFGKVYPDEAAWFKKLQPDRKYVSIVERQLAEDSLAEPATAHQEDGPR